MDKTGFLCKHTSHNAYHRMDYITVSETELFAIVYTTSDNILPTHTSPFSNQHTCTLWNNYTASFTLLRNIDLTGSWSKCWFTLMCKSLVHNSNFFSVCLSVRLILSLSFWTVDKKVILEWKRKDHRVYRKPSHSTTTTCLNFPPHFFHKKYLIRNQFLLIKRVTQMLHQFNDKPFNQKLSKFIFKHILWLRFYVFETTVKTNGIEKKYWGGGGPQV